MRGLVCMIVALGMLSGAAAADTADDVLGLWLTQSGNGVVEITRCGESVCGRIVGGRGERLDIRNRNPEQRARELMGLTILSGYRRSADRWIDGRIYNPEDGGSYRSELALGENGSLRVTGCLGPLCRTQQWTRTTHRLSGSAAP